MSTNQIVVGSTNRHLQIQFMLSDGVTPRSLVGYTSIVLQGASPDIAKTFGGIVGSIIDAPNGIVKWAGFGNNVVATDLGTKRSALFNLKALFTDSGGLIDYGPPFVMVWILPPV